MKLISLILMASSVLVLPVPADEPRDPFWPVGYQPKGHTPMQAEESENPLNFDNLTPQEQALIQAHMNVSGILKQGGVFFAFINGLVVKQDDVVPLHVGDKDYRFRIIGITKDIINLEPIRDKIENEKQKANTGEIP